MSGIRDNLSGGISRCKQISGLNVTVGFSTAGTIQADWVNPIDAKFKGVRIMYKTGSYPTSYNDGSVFYDSNDATPVSSYTKNGFIDGTTYYLRAFAYTYKNATRVYTTITNGAQASGTPLQTHGQVIYTTSGTFTVPTGVTELEVFLVGGGGGTGTETKNGFGGAGGGYTGYGRIGVTPGKTYSVYVGAGGKGGTDGGKGGTSSFVGDTPIISIEGGNGVTDAKGGSGGSGGGAGGQYQIKAGNGGSDGSRGEDSRPYNAGQQAFYYEGGTGQGHTTRAFHESGGTLYAGGGGGAWYSSGYPGERGFGGAGGGGNGAGALNTINEPATPGTANTGGGAGGATTMPYACDGGSGIVIIRWGN